MRSDPEKIHDLPSIIGIVERSSTNFIKDKEQREQREKEELEE